MKLSDITPVSASATKKLKKQVSKVYVPAGKATATDLSVIGVTLKPAKPDGITARMMEQKSDKIAILKMAADAADLIPVKVPKTLSPAEHLAAIEEAVAAYNDDKKVPYSGYSGKAILRSARDQLATSEKWHGSHSLAAEFRRALEALVASSKSADYIALAVDVRKQLPDIISASLGQESRLRMDGGLSEDDIFQCQLAVKGLGLKV
jgi:hypothetical protein